jgi:hypothetical protein
MPAHVEASPHAQGPFQPLHRLAEFRDAWKSVPAPPPADETIGTDDLPRMGLSRGVRLLLLGGGLSLAALLGMLARLVFFH